MSLDIYQVMEDWDDESLSDHEWEEQMRNIIIQYYDEYPETRPMSLRSRIGNYKSWKREKYAPEK